MAFQPPTFNLTADIYSDGDYPSNPPRVVGADCQWRTIAKMHSSSFQVVGYPLRVQTEILFPIGTDVRFNVDSLGTIFQDTIDLQVPGGSLPFFVEFVYDVGKGFSNEYRVALVIPRFPWPQPQP